MTPQTYQRRMMNPPLLVRLFSIVSCSLWLGPLSSSLDAAVAAAAVVPSPRHLRSSSVIDQHHHHHRLLTHAVTEDILPTGCVLLDYDHNISDVPAILRDEVSCPSWCGATRDLNVTILSVCTSLAREDCVTTLDCTIQGCNEDCGSAPGDCDCSKLLLPNGIPADDSVPISPEFGSLCNTICVAPPTTTTTTPPPITPNTPPPTVPQTPPPTVPQAPPPTTAPPPPTRVPVSAATLPPATAVTTGTVVQVVQAQDDLSTLATAFQSANVLPALGRAGPFTVFCPTDAAFVAAEPWLFKFRRPAYKAHLRFLLLFHITNGLIRAEDFVNDMSVVTLIIPREPIVVSVNNNNNVVSLGGTSFTNSSVVEPNIQADNGILHKVDQVFLPTALTLDLLENLQAYHTLTEVASLVVQAGLQDTLQTETLTLFCPSNDAIAKIAPDLLIELASDPDRIRRVLLYHMVPGVWHRERLSDGLTLTTIMGDTLTIKVGLGFFPEYKINNEAVLEFADAVAENGIIHIMDAILTAPDDDTSVLLPSSPPTTREPTSPPADQQTTLAPSTDADDAAATVECSVCMPGMNITRPDETVQIPEGVAEGITQATCAQIDVGVKSTAVSVAECGQLRLLYGEACGCSGTNSTGGPPPDQDLDTTPDNDEPNDEPTATTNGGYPCTLCRPGTQISIPDAIVQIPEGVATGISQASCSLLNIAVSGNSDNFTETICEATRNLYQEDCGCIPSDGPTVAPNNTNATYCTICEPGMEMTIPEAVIAIPAGLIVSDISFATCTLLESGLQGNLATVNDEFCPSLREFYSVSCGCKPIPPGSLNSQSPPSVATDSTSSANRTCVIAPLLLLFTWIVGGLAMMTL